MDASAVVVPEYFRRFIVRHFGELGQNWLAELPRIVSQYADAWELDVRSPFDGLSFNYVAPAIRRDGAQVVLKVGVPEPEQRSEIFALRLFAGRGIVRLIESNIDDHVSLLERLTPGAMLSTLFPQRDDEATTIAARIMHELAIPAPDDRGDFTGIDEWATRGMAGLRQTFDGGTGPFSRTLVERAEGLFRELRISTQRQSLMHGDLHHMNILSSDAHSGWLAIDPKGVIGDRAFEAAPFILNPNDAIHSVHDLRRLFDRRIHIMADLLDIDRQRIHGWTLAFSVLSAWWDYGNSDTWQPTLVLGEVLAAMET